jgi:PTS system N-acetylglucosamine-specific IIA component
VTVRVISPVGGRVVPLAEVPDPVFAQAMVGPGIAVDPERAPADAVSPVDGTVVTLHPHAFVVATEAGPAVLVHLGIDTVKLKGEGFTLRVVKGEAVRAGQPVVGWDPGTIEAAGYSAVCPVIALDAKPEELGGERMPGPVAAGDPLFTWHR